MLYLIVQFSICLVIRFIYIDVGSNDRASDGGVWRDCELNKLLEDNMASLPPAKPLTADGIPTP